MKDKIAPYVEQGLTAGEIHRLHPEWKYNTIYYAMPSKKERKAKAPVEEKIVIPVDRPKGWNKNRKGCKKCIYRGRGAGSDKTSQNGCNFIFIEGHSRGCKVEDCNVFVKGRALKLNPKGPLNDFDVAAEIKI